MSVSSAAFLLKLRFVLASLSLWVMTFATLASAQGDCNEPNDTTEPGECCQYGWRNDQEMNGYPDYTNPDKTESFGKISCLRWVFPIHLFFTFSIVILGMIAILLRLDYFQQYVFLHPWFGRAYILCLMGAMFSALLIHNEGLPLAVILNFVIALVCLAIAWVAIVVQKNIVHHEVLRNIGLHVPKDNETLEDLYEKGIQDLWDSKTQLEQFLSLYTLHGTLMFTAWFQFFGRFFYLIFLGSSYGHHYTNVGGDFSFQCYTYPVYKEEVPNYIFCNDTQTNDHWNACTEEEFCPVQLNNSSVMPWDPENLGYFWWVVLLVVVPFLLAALVFWTCAAGRGLARRDYAPIPNVHRNS